jgi:SWI/SNF chromatin-remodeling complex subunit SWI1
VASSILSLGDLVTIRKDTLYSLTNIAGLIQFSSNAAPLEAMLRMANQAFQLIALYLVDPTEAVSPLACVQLAGIPLSGHLELPLLPDISLEVFTKPN